MTRPQQISFWILVMATLVFIFGQADQDYSKAFYFVSFLMPIAIATEYFFNNFLVPKYLMKERYLRFGLYFFYTLVFSLYLEMIALTIAFILLANYRYDNLNPYSTNIFLLTATIYLIVFIKAFILLWQRFRVAARNVDTLQRQQKRDETAFINVRSNRQIVQIDLNELQLVESMADYVVLHISGEKIITKEKISALQDRLPTHFIRIHRSFLVNKNFVGRFNREEVELEDKTLPISRTYKKEAMLQLGVE